MRKGLTEKLRNDQKSYSTEVLLSLVHKTASIESAAKIGESTQVWKQALKNCRKYLNKEYNDTLRNAVRQGSPLGFTESSVLSFQFSTTKSVTE